MWRINFSHRIGSSRSLLAVYGAMLLSATAMQAQMQVNIVEPSLNAIASGTLHVRATVSSVIEVSTVTAEVEGQQVSLKYSQPLNAWTNSVPLAGIAFGPHTLVVNARDLFGGTAQAMRTFRVDNPPTLTVHEPINGTVVFNRLFLNIDATDDDPAGVKINVLAPGIRSYILLASATNHIQRWIDFPSVYISPQVAVISVTDSSGQTKCIIRSIAIEGSNLVETAIAPGAILDFDSERFLFTSQADILLNGTPLLPLGAFSPVLFGRPEPKIQNRQTGDVTSSRSLFSTWIDGPLDNMNRNFIASGLLGDSGCLLLSGDLSVVEPVFFGWDGSVANYSLLNLSTMTLGRTNSFKVVGTTTIGVRRFNGSEGAKLVLQDIIESNLLYEVAFPLGTSFQGDLGPNQDLIYVVSNSVYRSRPANPAEPYTNRTTTVLSSSVNGANLHVATDGTNVAYDFQNENPLGVNIQLITPAGDETLATWPNFIGPDFRLVNGWTAYTKPGTSGQTQIWTRSPSGTQQQRTFFNTSSTLESVGPNGEVTFIYNNARYVSLPGVQQPVWVNSGQGRVRWEDGKLLVILGRSILEFRMGQLQCAALAGGASRLTFTGPNGFSYLVQGSADLHNWTNLWTFTHTTGTISWTNPPANAPQFYRAGTAPAP